MGLLGEFSHLTSLIIIDGLRSFDFPLSHETLQNWAFGMYVFLSLLLMGGFKEKRVDKI